MEPPILTTLDARVDPRHSALVIIDMQKDFCAEGFGASQAGRDLTATRSIIPALEKMLASAREARVLIGHVGFWTLENHLSDSGPWLAQRRRSTYSSDKLCMENSEGGEFHLPNLAPPDFVPSPPSCAIGPSMPWSYSVRPGGATASAWL